MTEQTEKATLKAEDLAHFCGSETVYKVEGYWPFIYTEGVRHVLIKGNAQRLLDIISSHQAEKEVKRNPYLREMQFWTLTVNRDESAEVICEIDEGVVVVRQAIPFTDFPLPKMRFYLANMYLFWNYQGDGPRRNEHFGTLYLPSEH